MKRREACRIIGECFDEYDHTKHVVSKSKDLSELYICMCNGHYFEDEEDQMREREHTKYYWQEFRNSSAVIIKELELTIETLEKELGVLKND